MKTKYNMLFWFKKHYICTMFMVGFVIRVAFTHLGCMADNWKVKYTDIDYRVFTDAARLMYKGQSPFDRPTYRYTPFLAFMLIPNIFFHPLFGKYIFCLLDMVTCYLIYAIQNRAGYNSKTCNLCTCLWVLNPVSIVISSRGSCEAIMTSLVMLFLLFHQSRQIVLSGLVYGFAVHFKIYPCIYSLALYMALNNQDYVGWKRFTAIFCPNREQQLFVASSVFGFVIPTAVAYLFWGNDYLQEALLYHVSRKDIRHNFSPYFYPLYLTDGTELSTIISLFGTLLQAFLVALISWKFSSQQNLHSCLFLLTFVFVTFNKVCTSQYFMWYLCLLPLCYPTLNLSKWQISTSLIGWVSGQSIFLYYAYYLEFEGLNVFMQVWLSCLIFFVINVKIACVFAKCMFKNPHLLNEKEKKVK